MSGEAAIGRSNACKRKGKGNPYPIPKDWQKITAVKYCDPLILVRCKPRGKNWDGKKFIVGRAYEVKYKWTDNSGVNQGYHSIVVPCGLVTDLASIPRIARSVVSKVGPHVEASVVHDYLYGVQKEYGPATVNAHDRKFTEELFNRLMKQAGVSSFQRNLLYRACKWFGKWSFKDATNHYMKRTWIKCCCNQPHKICCDGSAEPREETGKMATQEEETGEMTTQESTEQAH